MARRNLDWMVGWWTERDAFDPEWPIQNGQVILTLITQNELDQYEGDLIVERVIGQYLIANRSTGAGDPRLLIHTRLTVRPEGPAGPFSADIDSFDMAEEEFMWHKVHLIPPNTFGINANLEPGNDPEWSHIDVRVNRKLQGIDRLCFIFDPVVNLDESTPAYSYAAWLRVLVRT